MKNNNTRINGEALRAYRTSIKMTLEELGRACMKTGQWVGGIEKGKPGHAITDLEVYKLAIALKVKVEDLEVE